MMHEMPQHRILNTFHLTLDELTKAGILAPPAVRAAPPPSLEKKTSALAGSFGLWDAAHPREESWQRNAKRLASELAVRPGALKDADGMDAMDAVVSLVRIFADRDGVMNLFEAAMHATTTAPSPHAFFHLKDARRPSMSEMTSGLGLALTWRQVEVRRAVKAIEQRWPGLNIEAEREKTRAEAWRSTPFRGLKTSSARPSGV